MGIAAAFLLLAAGYLLVPGHVARVYADAATDHRMEVVEQQPRHWMTDPAAIAALGEKLGISDAVPPELAAAIIWNAQRYAGWMAASISISFIRTGRRNFRFFSGRETVSG